MNYAYRKFGSYAKFVEFCNEAPLYYWELHSWQDVGDVRGTDIRALFVQDAKHHTDKLPEQP